MSEEPKTFRELALRMASIVGLALAGSCAYLIWDVTEEVTNDHDIIEEVEDEKR